MGFIDELTKTREKNESMRTRLAAIKDRIFKDNSIDTNLESITAYYALHKDWRATYYRLKFDYRTKGKPAKRMLMDLLSVLYDLEPILAARVYKDIFSMDLLSKQ